MNVIPLHNDPISECLACRALSLQHERGLKLHAQTATQLAQCEAKLVEAKRENRYLRSQLVSAIASLKQMGGDTSELLKALNGGEQW